MLIFLSLVIIIFLPSCGLPQQDKEVKTKATIPLKGFEMVSIKGSTFVMGGLDLVVDGGPKEENPNAGYECPHSIILEDFSIGKYEVTQAEWREIMGDDPSFFRAMMNTYKSCRQNLMINH